MDSGAVHVFARQHDGWVRSSYLQSSNSEAEDFSGEHVAADGDNLAVSSIYEASSAAGIGGRQDSNAPPNSGAAYMFH